jgi:hypothetical protein
MIFVEQRQPHDPENGIVGDCFVACLATVLELPYEDIPEFQNMGDNWWKRYNSWLYNLGYYVSEYGPDKPPVGYSIAVGPSPRFEGENHCVVALNGVVVFDPHPDRAGLPSIKYFETFTRYAA